MLFSGPMKATSNKPLLTILSMTTLVFMLVLKTHAQQAPATQPATPMAVAAQPSSGMPETQTVPKVEDSHPAFPPTSDPKEIMRRAVEIDHGNREKIRNYTCQNRQVIKQIGKTGEVKSTEIKTFEINFYFGKEYQRLVQVNDKPLDAKEEKKEEEKLNSFLAKYRDESESDREKRLAKEKKEREEGRLFLKDVVNAYDFRLLGSEKIDGVDAWVIEGTPRSDFHPTQPHSEMLKKIKGKVWIEKSGYNWVKVNAEAVDTISFGLFLFRIHPGSHFSFQQSFVNNEVWVMKRLDIEGGARIALFKNENVQQEDVLSNFRKYVTSVKILPDSQEVAPKQ
jgi:hypothetical protein